MQFVELYANEIKKLFKINNLFKSRLQEYKNPLFFVIMFIFNIYRFNQKPRKGIQFLQDRELLRSTPAEVAEWLHMEERLDKTAIGDFLGENDEACLQVCRYH